MPDSPSPYAEDLAFAERVLGGDDAAWNAFVERFSDRVWRRSWTLCNEACLHKHNRGGVFCVFHALAAGGVQPAGDSRPGCDEGLELYAFIFDYLFNRGQNTGKLKAYDGRAKLETFIGAVLRGHLRTDWIRHRRRLRLDQITLPDEIQRLEKTDHRVYEQMLMQRPTETIAREVGVSVEEAEAAQERITHALMANGNLHLILRNPEATPIEPTLAGEDLTHHILPMRRGVDALWSRLRDLIAELPEAHKILLDMAFEEELDAKTILARCEGLGIELPVNPRSGDYTIHSVYQSIDAVLKDLGGQLSERYPDLLTEARDWLDADDASEFDVSFKGLKALLKHVGLPATGSQTGLTSVAP